MNNKIEIFDNFLPAPQFEFVKSQFLEGNLPWYSSKVVHESLYTAAQANDNFQLVHTFYAFYKPQSTSIEIVNPIIEKLNPLAILKIKANLTIKTPTIIEHGYHTDYTDDVLCTTGVFYVNTTDGYTKFTTGEVVNSVENRLVLFPSNLQHTGTTCTDSSFRCVINLNFIPNPQSI